MKTYVITFSKNFPSYHTKKGFQTNFIDKILDKEKTTTIRTNFKRWNNIRRDVNNGSAILSLRYWSGKPYRSKQVEFALCSKLNTERVFITNDHNGFEMSINGNYCTEKQISDIGKSEGLSIDHDFIDWFNTDEFSGALISLLELTSKQ